MFFCNVFNFGAARGAAMAAALAAVLAPAAMAQTMPMPPPNNEAQITVVATPANGADFSTDRLEHNVPIRYRAFIQDDDGLPDPLTVTWTWRDATSANAFVVPGAVSGGQFLTHSLTIAGQGAGSTDPVSTIVSSWTLPELSVSGRDLISPNVALELCVSFTDSANHDEKGCIHTTGGTQNTENDPATGRPSIIRNASGTSSGTLTAVTGSVTQGWNLSVNTTHGATNTHSITGAIVPNPSLMRPAWAISDLDDPDRLPVGRSTGDFRFSWQRGESEHGPWTEVHTYTAVAGVGYEVTQEDVNAGWLRACVFYEDRAGFDEGGDDTDAGTRAASATVCTAPREVENANDLPTADGGRIFVSVDYNAANPYFFTAEDFGFSDDDPGDSLASVEITTLPPKNAAVSNPAAFRLGSDTVTAGLDVSLAQIPTLSYYRPTTGAEAGISYDRFTYKVTDNNGGESAAAGTIDIDLVETNAPARGAPAVIADTSGETAYNEDITLAMSITDSSHSVVDVDGIDTTSLTYQWQFAMPLADDPAAIPPPDAYQDLFGSTNATYTPTQQRVGQYIRGCISFTDSDGNAEGPLCSVPPLPISNTNDAPTSDNADITVSTDFHVNGRHYYEFTPEDFPFSDGDPDGGDSLASVIFVSLATAGTLYVDNAAMTVGAEVPISKLDPDALNPASYAVASGATATSNYATFTFKVVDDGSDGTDNTQSATHTMTINVVQDLQFPATGAPEVTATTSSQTAYNEDVELTAKHEKTLPSSGVIVPVINDINDYMVSTIAWQWQQADSADGPWSDIAGATATGKTSTFTPTQAHVGQHIRACASFTDDDGHAEGPLCNVPPSAIANTNDAPTSADFSIDVGTHYGSGHPFVIDFDLVQFEDDDAGATMEVFRIVTPPAAGTLASQNSAGTVTNITAAKDLDGPTLRATNNSRLLYWPAAGATPASPYATIEFQVVDNAMAASATHTITVNLVAASGQTAASGAPAAFGTRQQRSILSASFGGVVDPDGIADGTRTWQWQQSTRAEGPWKDIPGEDSDILSLGQQQVAQRIRVCLSYTDMGTPPADEGPLCGGGPGGDILVTNVNDTPGGDIVIAQDADDLLGLAELVEGREYSIGITTGGGSLEDADGLRPRLLEMGGRTSWQITDDPDGGTWAEIDYAGRGVSARARSITIAREDAEAGHMRVCLFYTDLFEMREGVPDGGTSGTEAGRLAGTICSQSVAVRRAPNIPPTGAPVLAVPAETPLTSTTTSHVPLVGNAREGIGYIAIITSGGGTVEDEDGLPPSFSKRYQVSVQTAADAAGPWSEIEFSDERILHAPEQAQTGMYIRHCIFYLDDRGTVEGFGPDEVVATVVVNNFDEVGASTRQQRETATLCTAPVMVDNVNDAPEALRSSVTATLAHTETSPFVFSAEDFGFTDEDGDAMKGIVVVTLPAKGTLALPADATVNLIAGREINLAAVNGLRWWPPDNASASNEFTHFDFRVRDDGTDPDATTNTLSTSELSNQAIRMTINLVNTARTDKVAADGYPHISSPGGYIEGATLTAGPKDLTDGNGINLSTLTWTWYSRASTDSSMGSTVSATSVTTAANGWASAGTGASFTIPATLVGHWMAVCATFDDLHPSDVTSESRCRGIDFRANLTVGNVNYPPTGAPAVSSSDNRDLDLVAPAVGATLSALPGTLGDADGLPDFTDTSAFYWNWHLGSLSEILSNSLTALATSPTLALLDDAVGKHVALCPNYTDQQGSTNTGLASDGDCWISAHPIIAINSEPTGRVAINITGNTDTTGVTQMQDNVSYTIAVTDAGGSLMDADGLSPPDGGGAFFADDGEGVSFQIAAAPSGPWTELAFGSEMDDSIMRVRPTQAQVGMHMRACLFYIDDAGHFNGGDGFTARARVMADSDNTCAAPVPIVNGNNKPETADFSLGMRPGGSYTFSLSDFVFNDIDGDNFVSVEISSLPGTTGYNLTRGGAEVEVSGTGKNNLIPVAEIASGGLVLMLTSDVTATPRIGTDQILFRVHDDGSDRWPTELVMGADQSSHFSSTGDIGIDIAATTQTDATGALTFVNSPTAFPQKTAIQASRSGVEDANSIDEPSVAWQWSQTDPDADDATMPDTGGWVAIAGADVREFTPEQPQVGKFLRVCLTFMDQFDPPARTELCLATAAAVTDSDDAPDSADSSVTVVRTADRDRPFRFEESDFPFTDADVRDLRAAFINIVGLPQRGTISSLRGLVVDSVGAQFNIIGGRLDPLFYHPLPGAAAAEHYDSFRFVVLDGNGNTSPPYTMTIHLSDPQQQAAEGILLLSSVPDYGTLDLTPPREDSTITASAATLTDANGIVPGSLSWQWSLAAHPAAPAFAPVAGATGPSFVLSQEHVGQLVRVCASFSDELGGAEQVCRDGAGPVQNTSDPTVALDSSVEVFVGGDFARPYIFRPSDFLFRDDDSAAYGLELDEVLFDSLPEAGTLLRDLGSGRASVLPGDGLRVNVFDDAGSMGLVYYPEAGAEAAAGYASFRFRVRLVRDDGTLDDDSPSEQSATMTINLVAETQQPASGRPSFQTTGDQGQPAMADAQGIGDPNGVDLDSLRWQWQVSGDDGNYRDVADATGEVFVLPQPTPDSTFFRVCASFEDLHPTPNTEGPLCSAPTRISDRNDPPTSADASVDVPVDANAENPFRFAPQHFPFMDPDLPGTVQSTFDGLRLQGLPSAGTMLLADTAPTSLADHAVDYAVIHQIGFYPDAGQQPQEGYATFGFVVEDDFGRDSETYTMTINLVAADAQIAAAGAPNYVSSFFPTEDREYEAELEGISEPNGIDMSTVVWQWQLADSEFGAYTNIAGANDDSYTPPMADVGRWIRACASFSDNLGNDEGQFCALGRDVSGRNDLPVGMDARVFVFTSATADNPFRFQAGHFPFMDDDDESLHGIQLDSVPLVGNMMVGDVRAGSSLRVSAADLSTITFWPDPGAAAAEDYASFSFRVSDSAGAFTNIYNMAISLVPPGPLAASGVPSLSSAGPFAEDALLAATTAGIIDPNGINTDTLLWVWQVGAAADGPFAAIEGATESSFTPLQAHVGQYIRVCLSFMDLFDTPTSEGPLCTAAALVINVNDAPNSADATVEVFTSTDESRPFVFSTVHFPFADEDPEDRAAASITIVTTPEAGTLTLDGAPVTAETTVATAQLSSLVFWPAAGTEAQQRYASFQFRLSDGRADSAEHTLSIDIVPPRQVAATGAPTVTATDGTAYDEDVPLTASTPGISEPNGIDEDSLEWQWQQSASADAGYTDLADAASENFTPLQAHVGQYIRVCVSFDDEFEDPASGAAAPASEGPLCSAGVRITNVNDAPVSDDSDIYVSTAATAADPYIFSIGDFPFTDEDEGASLASITLLSVPSLGTMELNDQVLENVVRTVEMADIASLSYYQEAGATEVQDNYSSFRFMVSDGTADSRMHTMNINIVSTIQMPATGTPSITGTLEQKATLSAGRGTVRDSNGINRDTIAWQWGAAAAADGPFTAIDGATDDEFAPTQAQVGMYMQVCMSFMDRLSVPGSEERCSDPAGPIANVNDAPVAADSSWQASRINGGNEVHIPAAAFIQAYSDMDGEDDRLESVTIVELPDDSDGILSHSGSPVTAGSTLSVTEAGEFIGGPMLFVISGSARGTSLDFTLSDGELDSNTATLTITFGKDIEQKMVQQVSAILSVAAVTNAANAISGAIAASSSSTFDLSADGTSLLGISRSLRDNLGTSGSIADSAIATDNTELPATMATADQRAWYLGLSDSWEHNAAYNASDNSAASLLRRINNLADGDLAMHWQVGGISETRLWARHQRLDLSGRPLLANNTELRYSGDSSGFYVGADQLVTESLRAGLALGFDDGSITMDLDEDGMDDEAHRNATSYYPYMRLDLSDGNELRLMAGFGTGDLDINSSANQGSATADISWQMFAATLSHSRRLQNSLSLRLDGSAQYSGSDITGGRFDSGARIMDASSATGELAMAAELRYASGRITPYLSTAMRRWYGDLSQAPALDLGAGADLSIGPLSLRAGFTRQVNNTIHRRHSTTLDISLAPTKSGISASFGNRRDSTSGRPQWNTTIKWQHPTTTLSLSATPNSLSLSAHRRW